MLTKLLACVDAPAQRTQRAVLDLNVSMDILFNSMCFAMGVMNARGSHRQIDPADGSITKSIWLERAPAEMNLLSQ